MTFASLFGSVFFGLVEALWLDPDSSLGHAALVGCGFGMVLSAPALVRHLATRSKTRRTARANCRSTVSRQKGGVNRLRTLGPRSRPLAADDRLPHPHEGPSRPPDHLRAARPVGVQPGALAKSQSEVAALLRTPAGRESESRPSRQQMMRACRMSIRARREGADGYHSRRPCPVDAGKVERAHVRSWNEAVRCLRVSRHERRRPCRAVRCTRRRRARGVRRSGRRWLASQSVLGHRSRLAHPVGAARLRRGRRG